MGDHENGHSMRLQFLQYPAKLFFVFRVHSLGRLIHKKDLRTKEKHFCKGKPLLFPAA